jgi:hypothetical protein
MLDGAQAAAIAVSRGTAVSRIRFLAIRYTRKICLETSDGNDRPLRIPLGHSMIPRVLSPQQRVFGGESRSHVSIFQAKTIGACASDYSAAMDLVTWVWQKVCIVTKSFG